MDRNSVCSFPAIIVSLALDACMGKPIQSFGDNGSVNLKEGWGDPSSLSLVQSHCPKDFRRLVILGSATNEGYSPPVGCKGIRCSYGSGFVDVPHGLHPGEFGYETWPADAWKTVGGPMSGPSFLDEERGSSTCRWPRQIQLLWSDREGTNLFSNCLVALDARTGERLWHFQFVHHDIWDYDPATSPKLLTVEHE